MKKNTLQLILFLFLHSIYAQQDVKLPGLVVEQNSQYRSGKVKYLSNAEVKSAGATPQRSDDNGQFTLVFTDRPGGDVARIFAAKSGYEVVNDEEMKQAAVIGRLQPLKIVMCEHGKLYDNQLAYYNIAKDAALAAYERKIATLQKQGNERERLIAELQVQFNHDIKTLEEAKALLEQQRQLAEKQAKELADKWVSINLDDESPAYRRAFAAFEAKNIELAKAILDSVDLEKRLALNSSAKAKEQALVDTLQKNIAKKEEEIRQDVNMCLFKARLHKLEYEWTQAERFYDLAIAYDEGNYDVTFEAAQYMQSQNQFSKAHAYYERALTQSNELFEKGTILNNWGILFEYNNEFGKAKKTYEEALQIFRISAEKNPDVYLPDVVLTLNNLGILLRKMNEMDGAKKVIIEALQIVQILSEKYADVYLPDEAMTLNNLGILLEYNNDKAGAKLAFERALHKRRQLAEKNPIQYMPDVVKTLNNLGILLKNTNEMGGAKRYYEEALQIVRKLADQNPDAYLPDLAMTLNNLGNLFRNTNEIDMAKNSLEEALRIRRLLAQKKPEVYLPYLATTLNNLGNLFADNKELSNAKSSYEEAMLIRRTLAEKNPDAYLPDLAMTLNNLGTLFIVNNEMSNAKDVLEEALQTYRTLAEKNPDAYLPDLAMTLNNLGNLLRITNDMDRANKVLEEALLTYRKLAEKSPVAYSLDLAKTDINLGVFYLQLLKNTGDVSLKVKGLGLMRDAEKCLAIFPETHPQVQQYRPYVEYLTEFFKQ